MSKLLIIRHGRTIGNKNKWFYGKTDLPLLPEGIEELEKQRNEGLYPEISESALCFTTGLGRTAETFRVVFGERDYEPVKDLRELDFGVCECKSFDELKDEPLFKEWLNDQSGEFVFPEGESQNNFKERVHRGFQYVLDRHAENDEKNAAGDVNTVVVCHGGVIAEILDKLFPGEKESVWDWMPEPGSGYLLDIEDGKVKNPCLLGSLTIY